MLIKKSDDIPGSEITDEKLYNNRRKFLRGAMLAGSVGATAWLYRTLNRPGDTKPQSAENDPAGEIAAGEIAEGYRTPEGEPANTFEEIANYNNFYEFSTSKQAVAVRAKNFITRPWTVEVSGLVHKPKTFDIDDLLKLAPLEERVYRFRCVEAWSMVIPWMGFPLRALIDAVEPLGEARYVKFITLYDPKRMPNQTTSVLPWPYIEGLRLDEARHPLTLLATGLYGRDLPPQNGAPVRLVAPWKYGFKGVKSIVQIVFVRDKPGTTWADYAPNEYGFYANVNPQVDHPRWSQKRERRIGEWSMRKTLPFNGYADQVASLYSGMDLNRQF
ncbi:MAG: protein-methionine-sulfoxide reductase catalytic subunit MsrP [Blastocatellales bacterium]|nr:protein-methionine-sulfoxide reductase catalytic subunit MsrP [Blastocatellales bacterium]